jgi:hypothetical protein
MSEGYLLELEHPRLTSYAIYNHGQLVNQGNCDGCVEINIPLGSIQAWINPADRSWGFLPMIRIDGFLVNTYLAGIKVWDHALEFDLDHYFHQRYNERVRASIIDSVPERYRNDWSYISKYRGMSPKHDDLVREIRTLLGEEHTVHNHPRD